MAWQRNASWRTEYSLFPWWLSCWRERAQGCPSPCIGSVLCQGLWQVPGQGMSQRTPSGNWQRMRQNLAVGVYEQDSKGFTLTWSLIWIWLVRFPLVLVCFLSNSKILNSLFSKISNSVAAAWLSCFFFFFLCFRETLETRDFLEKVVKKERWGYQELLDPPVNLV